jgi:hypothetical protein
VGASEGYGYWEDETSTDEPNLKEMSASELSIAFTSGGRVMLVTWCTSFGQLDSCLILPPTQGIRCTRISRRTLNIKIKQHNLDYIICN